ncbi:MAG: hypothetical protein ACREF9_06870 [Opitutaceae bacterium]
MNHGTTGEDIAMGNPFELIRRHLAERYPGDFHRTAAVREFLGRVCQRHLDLDLGDGDLAQKLCSGDESRYWQQLSEILLAHELLEAGLTLTSSRGGPDFLIEHFGQRTWIEVICPQPEGIPADWLAQPTGRPYNMPHEAILLRWTAAIKEKAEKLLGNAALGKKGYREKGVVGAKDAYVIAVNARLLRGPYFASITGISQFPFAAEAVFAIGPYAVSISPETMKIVGGGHQHRPTIRKPNGADVPAYTFLDPAFRPVSAIWALDVDESWVIGNTKAMAVVHNPDAETPVPVGLLPSYDEYVATPDGPDEYRLDRIAGRLRSTDPD